MEREESKDVLNVLTNNRETFFYPPLPFFSDVSFFPLLPGPQGFCIINTQQVFFPSSLNPAYPVKDPSCSFKP